MVSIGELEANLEVALLVACFMTDTSREFISSRTVKFFTSISGACCIRNVREFPRGVGSRIDVAILMELIASILSASVYFAD